MGPSELSLILSGQDDQKTPGGHNNCPGYHRLTLAYPNSNTAGKRESRLRGQNPLIVVVTSGTLAREAAQLTFNKLAFPAK